MSAAGGWGLPLVVLVAGMFMAVLDTSIVNVAIAAIQNQFGGTTDDVQWVVTGYTLVLGVVVPATAWLGDRFGLSRVYTLALLAFAAGSALCGLAWDLNSLVVFRIIQAIPGGILPAITLSILLRIVPRRQIGTAMGLYGLGVVFAPAVGPSLGGYLVEYVNWRLIFYINVPIGILGAVAAVLVLPSFPARIGQRLDVPGFVTIAGGLFSLLLALSQGESWGWSSYPIVGLFLLAALGLTLFVVIELEVDHPLLDLRVFRYWPFPLSMTLLAIITVTLFGMLFYIPLYLQQAQGLGAFNAGLTLLPQALVTALLMPIVGWAYDRIGPRWLVAIGLATLATGNYLLHTLALDTPREHTMWLLLVVGTGMGLAMMPIFTAGLAAIPVAQSNVASALNNVVRNVSGSFGVAMFTAIWTIQKAQQLAGRSALLPANTPIPPVGPPGTPEWLSVWALYHQTQQYVFVQAMDNLFLISAALGALGALTAALFLRTRTTIPTSPAPPQQATAFTAEVRAAQRADTKIERVPIAPITEGNQ